MIVNVGEFVGTGTDRTAEVEKNNKELQENAWLMSSREIYNRVMHNVMQMSVTPQVGVKTYFNPY